MRQHGAPAERWQAPEGGADMGLLMYMACVHGAIAGLPSAQSPRSWRCWCPRTWAAAPRLGRR